MAADKQITEQDAHFIRICEQATSTQEAMTALGVSDNRGFRRRRANVEKRYGIKLPRYSSAVTSPDVSTHSDASVEARLTQRITDLQGEVRNLRELAGNAAMFKQLIHKCLDREAEPPKWLHQKRKHAGMEHGIPTLFLSDLHWDEIVHPSQINYVNEFNRDIAIQRLKHVIDTTVYLTKEVLSPSKYDGFVLALGGDMFSGYIHDELRENKSGPIFDGVMNLADHLIAAIDVLQAEFGRVFVPCVAGNHGRLDRKPRAKFGVQDNVDWLLYHLLKRHYTGNKDVQFLIPDSADAYYRVYNVRYMLTHGNQFRGGTGIAGPATPWALGDHKKRKRQVAINQPYDTLIFGHWHMLAWGPNNSYVVNGSLKGYDEYAFNANFGFEPAKQALWLTHPDHGITHKMEVFADKQDDKPSTDWVSVLKE